MNSLGVDFFIHQTDGFAVGLYAHHVARGRIACAHLRLCWIKLPCARKRTIAGGNRHNGKNRQRYKQQYSWNTHSALLLGGTCASALMSLGFIFMASLFLATVHSAQSPKPVLRIAKRR